MKKLIIRADDVGYTSANNDGVFKAIDQGIVTSADLMLDTPGSIDAMIRLRERPWISVGWHTHFWGSPVLDPHEVSSMVNETGRFRFRHNRHLMDECNYDELIHEMRAQLARCRNVLGHVPSYTEIHGNGLFARALKQVCDEYGIRYHFVNKPDHSGVLEEADPEYRKLDIYMPNQPAGYYRICYDDSVKIRETYDPVSYFIDDYDHLMQHSTVLTAWHPGYLDDYILRESSLKEARVKDIIALTSPVLKQWLVQNSIQLVSTLDVLTGTKRYQEHLKQIGSALYIH